MKKTWYDSSCVWHEMDMEEPICKCAGTKMINLSIGENLWSGAEFHPLLMSMWYRIAGNFRGRKLSRISENTIFAEKTLTDCSLLQRQRMPHPKFAKVFSLKSFLLYSIILVMNETRSSPYVSLLLLQLPCIITNSRRGRERGFLMNYLLLSFSSFFHHFMNPYTPAIIPITAAIVATMPNMTTIVPSTIAIMLSVLSPPAGPVVPLVAAACVCVQNTKFINFGTLILKQKPSHLT